MNLFFSRKRRGNLTYAGLGTDIHSHLLPGLDDGVRSLEEAEEVARAFASLGYRRLVTTPHVMSDLYRNTRESILAAHRDLTGHLKARGVDITVDAAAEYYLDEVLMDQLNADNSLLTFGKNFILFETNFMTEPLALREFIFAAQTKGYQPVLAHPERYLFLQNDLSKADDLLRRGVLFQINIGSLAGQYGPDVRRAAIHFIRKGWIHFLGSDCHNALQIRMLPEILPDRHLQKALSLSLMNPLLN